ncbi:MAG: hypothetical protein CMC36_02525 [Flavobacteriaceae bacterium]|nr:hypothetical protein [Flavobacteriaceae bacterium]MAU30770.1 hypothetical protein [Flavobacteriaceae bacterium]|tara:strand:+ start:7353 stop:8132 length:780 start_codon:yes stop_codon:yes gene_type:complete
MRTQLLFLFVFLNYFSAHNQITLDKIDRISYDNSNQLIWVDNLGESYFLEGDKLRKNKNFIFSDSSLGLLNKVDFYNNFKLKVWYPAFNTLVILDNYLNEITRVQFNKASSIFEISNISSANENDVWVYDESDMSIKKFDFFNQVFIDNVQTQIDGNLIDMKSNYNYLWALTEKHLYKINYNGLIIFKKENRFAYTKIGFYKNDILLSNESELYHLENDKELFTKIKLEKLFVKDFFVINETLYIYDKDHLNKYLILSN